MNIRLASEEPENERRKHGENKWRMASQMGRERGDSSTSL